MLPDFVHSSTGYIKGTKEDPSVAASNVPSEEQILPMNNERFTVPELLMRPGDIGIDQAGISEAIRQSVQACPGPGIQPYSHIKVAVASSAFS